MPLKALSIVVLVIGKAQFRRAMLSCDSSCFVIHVASVDNVLIKKNNWILFLSGLFDE